MSDIIAENKGTFDKVYNEYIYTAATRGIPSAVVLAVLLISVLVIGFRKFRKNRKWQSLCMLILALGGVLLFLIGCSNICYSAVFWTVAGLCCADAKEK